jgi:murein DD-endopeptidase MepM/ murein hydrolase activator NlpD
MRRALALLLALAAPAAAKPVDKVDQETIARDAARESVDGKYDDLVARFTPEMAAAVPRAKIEQVMAPLRAERGAARSVVVRMRNDHADGAATFTVKGNWTRGPVSDIELTVRPDGRISGMLIHDEAPPADRFDAYQPKARLRPPFHGRWTAHNAARDKSNPHFTNPNQRFAVDWVMAGADGKSFRGDGRANQDYLCWGQDALAPADGTVAIVVDGVPENPVPGARDSYNVGGNHVVIDLGAGEYAMLFHLQPGSMRVKVGDKVKTGQVLAKVGNSGNSSEPHLHFQLSNRPRLIDAAALPAWLGPVLLDGKRTERALPGEKQTVEAIEK